MDVAERKDGGRQVVCLYIPRQLQLQSFPQSLDKLRKGKTMALEVCIKAHHISYSSLKPYIKTPSQKSK